MGKSTISIAIFYTFATTAQALMTPREYRGSDMFVPYIYDMGLSENVGLIFPIK